MTKSKTRDVAQEVTDKIIAAMEQGTTPWRADWTATGGTNKIPVRSNGLRYRGINVLMLWLAQMEKGYTSPQWMTFRQAQELGGCVRKGEKGSMVVKVGTFEPKDSKAQRELLGDDQNPMMRTYLKGYTVFNVAQIDGLPDRFQPAPVEPIDTGARAISGAEEYLDAIGANVVHDGTQPRYIPSTDTIHMPAVSAFETAQGYYATRLHETIHWTGATKRLDRLSNGRDRKAYAFEELVAEIGACIACRAIGIEPQFDMAASYVESWLKALRSDKRHIFKAAGKAQAAVDFMDDLQARRAAEAA